MIRREIETLQEKCLKTVARHAPKALTPSSVEKALSQQTHLRAAARAVGHKMRDVRPTLLARLAEAGALLDGVLPDGFWLHFERRAVSLATSKVASRTLTAACNDAARVRDARERAGAGELVSGAAPTGVRLLMALDLTGCFLVGDDEVTLPYLASPAVSGVFHFC